MNYMDSDKVYWEEARRELHKNGISYIEQILEATFHEIVAIWPHTSYL